MTRPSFARPTVYIESLPALRWRRATLRFLGPRRRLRRMLAAVGILAVLVGSLGVTMYGGGHESDAAATPPATCQDEMHAHAAT